MTRRLPGCGQFAALAAALPLSAALTAAAIESADLSWLAWMSLLPLFWAIRSLGSLGAMLSGALWGGCLYGFSTVGAAPAVSPTFWAAALLTAVPGLYAASCSLLTRRIGFNPLLLGLGWILVEIALKPVGLRHGLLAGTQGDSSSALWVGRTFGSVFVAVLVVWANASLLAVLSSARLSIPRERSWPGLPACEAGPSAQPSRRVQLWALGQAYPRAPPITMPMALART